MIQPQILEGTGEELQRLLEKFPKERFRLTPLAGTETVNGKYRSSAEAESLFDLLRDYVGSSEVSSERNGQNTASRVEEFLIETGRMTLHSQLENHSRELKLFQFITSNMLSGSITSQTAGFAWEAWTLLNEVLSNAIAVPDASYGPDKQFLFLWDRAEHHLELEIEPDGAAYFFYRNRLSGTVWDNNYQIGKPLIPEIIEKLRLFS